jgi:hypothetical protein
MFREYVTNGRPGLELRLAVLPDTVDGVWRWTVYSFRNGNDVAGGVCGDERTAMRRAGDAVERLAEDLSDRPWETPLPETEAPTRDSSPMDYIGERLPALLERAERVLAMREEITRRKLDRMRLEDELAPTSAGLGTARDAGQAIGRGGGTRLADVAPENRA